MVKKNILLVLYFLQFYISSLWGKIFMPNLTNSQEPEPQEAAYFWPLGVGAGAALKKIPEPGKNYPASSARIKILK